MSYQRHLTVRALSEAVAAEWLDSMLYHIVWMRRGVGAGKHTAPPEMPAATAGGVGAAALLPAARAASASTTDSVSVAVRA